jgi:hypothetical protein
MITANSIPPNRKKTPVVIFVRSFFVFSSIGENNTCERGQWTTISAVWEVRKKSCH